MSNDKRKSKKMSEGDAAAWAHAIASGKLDTLSDFEKGRCITFLFYTNQEVDKRGATTEAEMEALIAWATETRIRAALLDNLIAGGLFVRIRDGEPAFSLSPKGEADAKRAAEQMGLPVDEDDAHAD